MDRQMQTESPSPSGFSFASDSTLPGSDVPCKSAFDFDPLCIGKESSSLRGPKRALEQEASVPSGSAPGLKATPFESSANHDDTWSAGGSNQDSQDSFSDVPALLDVEACNSSDSEEDGDEPPALIRDSESELGYEVDAEMDAGPDSDMDSLPELRSDTDSGEEEPAQYCTQPATTRQSTCSCCNAQDAMQGVEEGLNDPVRASLEQVLMGRGFLGFNAGGNLATSQNDTDSDSIPDLLDADDESDNGSDASNAFDVESALRDTAAAFLGLLPTVFQRGAASAPGGPREAWRRERRQRGSRGQQPTEEEGGGTQRRRVFPLRRGNRPYREVAASGSGALGGLPVFRFPVPTGPVSSGNQRQAPGTEGEDEQGSGLESDDESVPSLLSANDEDSDGDEDEYDEEDEDEDEDDDDGPPLLAGADSSDDDDAWAGYADMPELLADTMSSMDSDDEYDEEDGEHTPPPRRARIVLPGNTLPGGVPLAGPLGMGLNLQMGVEISNIGIEFVRNRLFAFGPGDFVPDEHLEEVLAMLGSAANPHWPPPASKDAVAALERVVMSDEPGDQSCSVCRSALEAHVEVLRMPCSHLFHPDCLNPWLDVRNSCPLCRFQLPTDDQGYEEARQQAAAAERTEET